MTDKMKFEDIDPFVRYAQFLTVTSNRQYTNIASYDYRLFFCCGGSGRIMVDNVTYEMKIGSLVIWPPGIRYSLLLGRNSQSVDLMGVNFDYTRNFKDHSNPIPPAKWRNFDPDLIVERIVFRDYPEFNSPLYIPDIQFLGNPTYNLVTEFISKKNFYIPRIAGLLKSNLSLVARFVVHSRSASKSEFLVDKIIQYIHSHYREEITNQTLGEYFGYHPNHLNRLLVRHTGMSIHKYLINCRVDAAIELIQASDLRAAEIAEAVGFHDTTHFLKYFKKVTGKTTKDFRR